jgi:hypothetical protein
LAEDNELLILHNHPYNPLNFLFDNLPLASRRDRLTLSLGSRAQPRAACPQSAGPSRILFYLGENGYVKEFRLRASWP